MPHDPEYIPPLLSDLEEMARGTQEALETYGEGKDSVEARRKALEDAFETKLWHAFRSIGLAVLELGHKKPGERVPDGIARFPHNYSFALLLDAKIRSGSYSMTATDQRAFREYVEVWSPQLDDDYEVLYLVIVSSDFAAGIAGQIGTFMQTVRATILSKVVLINAATLLRLVELGVREPRLDRSFFERLFRVANPELVEGHILHILGEEQEKWGIL